MDSAQLFQSFSVDLYRFLLGWLMVAASEEVMTKASI